MKFLLILISTILLIASCGKPQSTNNHSDANSPEPYLLDVCLVSGEKLGSMGEPVVIPHEGREIKFCCDSCQSKFEKDTAKYLSKLK